MASLTIKNVPSTLLRRLKRRAAANRRSLNLEVIASLESTVEPTLIDPEALLARVRAARIVPRTMRLTDRALTAMKDGRPVVIVADTNLLVYLYVRGERTEQAEAVVARDPVWAAPLLWRSEFRNTLVGMLRRGAFRVDEVLRVIREAEQGMRGRGCKNVTSDHVLQLAAASRCSAYDCEFVALAQDLGVSLVTADQEILASFPDTAVPLTRFAH